MSDIRITPSQALLRGLDTMLHSDNDQEKQVGESFASILSGIVGDANSTDAAAHNSIELMATGDYDTDIVMLNSTKAELTLNLVLEVRDKVVEAYNEVMRMQV